jgi:hypothetical protein
MVTTVDPNAARVPLATLVCSHVPPEVVLASTENVSDPPPVFDTVIDRLTAAAPFAYGYVSDAGTADRLG